MTLPDGFELRAERRVLAALLSAVLHFGVVLIVLSGGRHDGAQTGETPSMQLVWLEAPAADSREGVDLTPLEPTLATEIAEQLPLEIERPASLPSDTFAAELSDAPSAPLAEPAVADAIATDAPTAAAALVMPAAERAALAQRLEQLAAELAKQPQASVTWEQDGKQYSALLIQERANDGTALDRVIAQVSAADRGKRWATSVVLKRLAFSQFTQMVDRWDPLVQLHDDVIVGRFHTNSRFNVLNDSQTAPTFLGKVTTSAGGIDMQSVGRRVEAKIFRGGLETRAGRISLPAALQPSQWAPQDGDVRIHELARDTRIWFFADGSYSWLTRGSPAQYLNAPSEHPVYFIATGNATLSAAGVVAGKILLYSPHRIVVEGSLTYAHDPRADPESQDYLGLVCDKYIEVASPSVTGPGDLQIQAALFAGRRFIVRDTEHRRSATLRIYGSLAAGSLSASEPRYATQIEYDERFEQRRPPGFPSTDRYEAADWGGQWNEVSEQMADDAL